MKKLIFISLLFSILSLSVSAQKPTKAEKAAQLEQEFQQTRQLIESNHFQFELNRVHPQGGQDLSRFNPRGKFVITDSVAKGTLPFFGRAYSLPYGEGGGIEFDGVMKDQSLKIEHKKKRKPFFLKKQKKTRWQHLLFLLVQVIYSLSKQIRSAGSLWVASS